MQMVLPLDVDFLVSNSLEVLTHNQQLLEMASSGNAVVIPAWDPTVTGDAGQQIATKVLQGKLATAGSQQHTSSALLCQQHCSCVLQSQASLVS